jgi:SAM-dependent methyltransferase
MQPTNVAKVLSMIADSDRVLDIGGWAMPFPRADVVVDTKPYETRGMLGRVYDGPERFSAETWHVRDLCAREPFPFPDKYFDYVICSHVLEDIRDPIFVASEIERIGKRGYVETPSRLVEQSVGVESRKYCGYCHHRWYVESEGDGLVFTLKSDWPMRSWKLHLPRRVFRGAREEETVVALFWDGHLPVRERLLITLAEIERDLEGFVRKTGCYSPARYRGWEVLRRGKAWLTGAARRDA